MRYKLYHWVNGVIELNKKLNRLKKPKIHILINWGISYYEWYEFFAIDLLLES
jgi:hypothetical protein